MKTPIFSLALPAAAAHGRGQRADNYDFTLEWTVRLEPTKVGFAGRRLGPLPHRRNAATLLPMQPLVKMSMEARAGCERSMPLTTRWQKTQWADTWMRFLC